MENSKTVVLTFAGGAQKFGGIQVEDFQRLRRYTNITYKSFFDRETSLFNRVNVNDIIPLVEGYDRVIALGNSMGGYNAIMFSNFYPVDTVISFAAPYSLHPTTPPYDKRWEDRLTHIKEWKYKHLEFNDSSKYFLIYGDDPNETQHLDLIPKKPNIQSRVFKDAGHSVSKKLLRQGILYNLLDNIVENNELKIDNKIH